MNLERKNLETKILLEIKTILKQNSTIGIIIVLAFYIIICTIKVRQELLYTNWIVLYIQYYKKCEHISNTYF